MTVSPIAQQQFDFRGDDALLTRLMALEARVEVLESRVEVLESRREIRTHAKVIEREHRIIETLERQTVPVTIPVLAGLIGTDMKLTDSTCRKLAADGRIIRADVGSRTPHYAAVR